MLKSLISATKLCFALVCAGGILNAQTPTASSIKVITPSFDPTIIGTIAPISTGFVPVSESKKKSFANNLKSAATTVFVDVDAIGNNDGTSWANAYNDLQDAIANANGLLVNIWVAEGTYYPSNTSIRNETFMLKDNMALYGGFKGNETTLSQRDVINNPTILSGDIDQNGILNTDNSRNVVTILNLNSPVALDGFTVTGGYTDNDNYYPNSTGGGVAIANSYYTIIRNCIIKDNYGRLSGGVCLINGYAEVSNSTLLGNTAYQGGGITLQNSQMEISNSTLLSNSSNYGGAILNFGNSRLTITNSIIANNNANTSGGGCYNLHDSYITINNSTFSHNTANYGDGIYNEVNTITINNSIFNHSNDFFGDFSNSIVTNSRFVTALHLYAASANNISDIPLFVDAIDLDGADDIFGTNDDGLRLSALSPCINTGDNNLIPNGINTDFLGNLRIQNTTVDMGAYEYFEPKPDNNKPSITPFNKDVSMCANSVSPTIYFNVSDIDGDNMIVTTSSTNSALVPNTSVKYNFNQDDKSTGTAIKRNLTITPPEDAYGTCTVIVTVTDGVEKDVRSFTLTVKQSFSSTDSISACNNFTWPLNGVEYSESGTYTTTLAAENGCDSIVTLVLAINKESIDNSVSFDAGVLTANADGYAYQWINCDNGTPVQGADQQSFTPTVVGNYAVVLSSATCSITSGCIAVSSTVGIDNTDNLQAMVYPNPSNGLFTVNLSNNHQNSIIEVYDTRGKKIHQTSTIDNTTLLDLSDFTKGNYMLHISNAVYSTVTRIAIH
tara:strand:- start:146301 stop:148649 length:2349 start_codon:yes stop_codon:yes gene_type:complete